MHANLGEAARDARNRGDLTTAINCLRELVAMEPSAQTWAWLGSYYLEQDRLTEALEAFDSALAMQEDFAPALSSKGTVLEALGRLDEAVFWMQRAIASKPSAPRYVMLGDLQAQLQNWEAAESNFRMALEIEPSNEEAMYNLAVLIRHTEPREARELLMRATRVDPLDASIRRELGYEAIRAGDTNTALHELETALAIDAGDGWTHIYLGIVHWRLQALNVAAKKFKRAADLRPLWTLPPRLLELVTHEVGAAAVDCPPKNGRLAIGAADTDAAVHVAKLLASCGLHEEARCLLRDVLAVEQAHRDAALTLSQLKTLEA